MELVIVDLISFSGLNYVFKLIDKFLQSKYNLTSRCEFLIKQAIPLIFVIHLFYVQHFFEILRLLHILFINNINQINDLSDLLNHR